MNEWNDISERDWLDVDMQSAVTDIQAAEDAVPGQRGYCRIVGAALKHVREFATLSSRGEYTDPSVAPLARRLESAAATFLEDVPLQSDGRPLIPAERVAELLTGFRSTIEAFLAVEDA